MKSTGKFCENHGGEYVGSDACLYCDTCARKGIILVLVEVQQGILEKHLWVVYHVNSAINI